MSDGDQSEVAWWSVRERTVSNVEYDYFQLFGFLRTQHDECGMEDEDVDLGGI